jgi:hypothetical protein
VSLQCQLFRGDSKLEAAAVSDPAHVVPGAVGEHVAKIQQALITLDGAVIDELELAKTRYGTSTANAVLTYKTKRGIINRAYQTKPDNIVGKMTMASLDSEMLAAEAAEAAAAAAESPADIILVSETNPDVVLKLVIDNFKMALDVSGEIANEFNVSSNGQMFWSEFINIELKSRLNALLAEATERDGQNIRTRDRELNDFVVRANKTRSKIHNDVPQKEIQTDLAALSKLAEQSQSTQKSNMKDLIHLSESVGAGQAEATFWKRLNDSADNQMIDLHPYRSLTFFNKLRVYERSQCAAYVHFVVRRLTKRGYLPAAGAKPKKLSGGLVFRTPKATAMRDRRPRESDGSLDAGGNMQFGDVLVQTGVATQVSLMKGAIDAGQLLEARVLSGVGFGTKANDPPIPGSIPNTVNPATPEASEEHSLIIIGRDDSDRFVFHDPDASQSQVDLIPGQHPDTGFGLLYFDSAANRLSTAAGERTLAVDAHGKHAHGVKRYQIVQVFAVT